MRRVHDAASAVLISRRTACAPHPASSAVLRLSRIALASFTGKGTRASVAQVVQPFENYQFFAKV